MKKLLFALAIAAGAISWAGPATADAVCRDGTYSYSSGQGTCSWHGGVDYWVTNGKPQRADAVPEEESEDADLVGFVAVVAGVGGLLLVGNLLGSAVERLRGRRR